MSDLKAKNPKELRKLIAEKKSALQEFRLGNARSKTKNVKEGRGIRKEIAQIMTALNANLKASASAGKQA